MVWLNFIVVGLKMEAIKWKKWEYERDWKSVLKMHHSLKIPPERSAQTYTIVVK